MIIDCKKLNVIMAEQQVRGSDLAQLANITTTNISLIRRGYLSPTAPTVGRIADALGVNVEAILPDETASTAIKAPPPAWVTDYEVYRAESEAEIKALLADDNFMRKMAQYHPRSDILLSIEKSWNTFWGTEEGWENKRKNKANKINWKSTIARTLQYSLVPKVNPYGG